MTVTREEIGAEEAAEIVRTAIAHARDNGWEVCAALTDPRGHLAALMRTDHVEVTSIGFAIDKSYTSAMMRRATEALSQAADSKPPFRMGLANRDRLLLFPGGLPIFNGTTCIGGLGVSGAQDAQDIACGTKAIEAAGYTIAARPSGH